jgi:predicted RNase H-like nuclease (RuvC/YqgF family)
LKSELASYQQDIQSKKEELQNLRPKMQLADLELGRITMQFRQLEMQLKEATQKNQELTNELAQIHSTKSATSSLASVPDKSTQKEKLQKDDLKLMGSNFFYLRNGQNIIPRVLVLRCSKKSAPLRDTLAEFGKSVPLAIQASWKNFEDDK